MILIMCIIICIVAITSVPSVTDVNNNINYINNTTEIQATLPVIEATSTEIIK